MVGETSDGTSAVAQARALRPDVILMDVRMPGMNGIEATAAITAQCPGEENRALAWEKVGKLLQKNGVMRHNAN